MVLSLKLRHAGLGRLAAVLGLLVCAASASAQQASPFMRIYGPVQPPYGFVLFCESFPEECVDGDRSDQRVTSSAVNLAELDEVNRAVNKAIQPATDMEVYGVSEHWTIPTTRGDCEDYALLKRQILIRRGWPVGSLLITVVRDEKGEGHAVLTARTTQGDFILDNKIDDLRLWTRTPYEYVMRQSYVSPRSWLSLDPRNPNMLTASTREKPAGQAAVALARN